MPVEVQEKTERAERGGLPLRDWIVLPALAMFTIAGLFAAAELLARIEFKDAEAQLAPCLVLNDESTGVRGIPDSTCWAKGQESDWAEYKFNSRGHRAGAEWRPKAPGSYRIVMTGSSIAMGLYVPVDKSIAGLLPAELSNITGSKTEVYNTSIGAAYGGTPHSIALRANEIFAAKPDLILWILTPWDVYNASELKPEADFLKPGISGQDGQTEPISPRAAALHRLAAKVGVEPAATYLMDRAKELRFRVLFSHYLFESRSLYVKSYLMNADAKAGFLKSEWSPDWTQRLGEFDEYAGQIMERAKHEGVPLAAVLIPNRAQAAMISSGTWPAGYDPYRLDNELRTDITRRGGSFIDILPDFRSVTNPESDYMPVDGHPYAQGHALLAELLAKHLAAAGIPSSTAQAASARAAAQ